jgi:long-chain acyl-CoA synthetase
MSRHDLGDTDLNLAALLTKTALSFPDRPAVALGRHVLLDYRALARRAAIIAGNLPRRFGLKPGDRVGLAMKNVPDYVEMLWGIWHAGLTAVPINAKLHPKEFAYILEDSGAAVCIATPELADAIAPELGGLATLRALVPIGSADHKTLLQGDPAPLAEVAPDDLAWLFYTSGTTGRPKGAMLSHRNMISATMNYFADVDSVEPGECIIHSAPISHGSGLYATPHVAKASLQVIPESAGFEPPEILELLRRYRGVAMFAAPTMVTRLINHPGLRESDTSGLKTVIYGGGPMYVADIVAALDVLGDKFVQIYGQGESPMTITGLPRAVHADRKHPRWRDRLGSAGIARTDVDVRVVDEDDRDVPVGEIGEVICRGDVVMRGYWQNPEATASALRGGWLHTGDMGAFDEDGFLTLKDRSKDMIISGGTNIYPREIEEVLLRHKAVLECSVVGRPHADWGEEVVAFVVAHPGAEVGEAALDQLCLDNIARFKRPKAYRFVQALPKNNYGKVLKTELRKQLADEQA